MSRERPVRVTSACRQPRALTLVSIITREYGKWPPADTLWGRDKTPREGQVQAVPLAATLEQMVLDKKTGCTEARESQLVCSDPSWLLPQFLLEFLP